MPDPAPDQPLTVLAFDYVSKKIGGAIGNTLARHARPLEILRPKTRERRFALIQDLLEHWGPDLVVVGLPLNTDGSDQYATLQARRFGNQLHGRFGVQVQMVDERGSSMEAQARLGTNEPDDAMAAAVILQRFLDAY